VVNLPHVKGKVEALNALVEISAGAAATESPWIAVLDCDDTWKRDKLVQQWFAAQALPQQVAVIGTLCSYFGDVVSPGPRLQTEFIQARSLWYGNPIINSSAIIRREFARWEDRFGLEDYDLWFRILLLQGKLAFNIPSSLVYHRIHAGSAFNGKGRQDVEGLCKYYRSTQQQQQTQTA
jgi:glycosyltransferase involved in cell wall biosynthesis